MIRGKRMSEISLGGGDLVCWAEDVTPLEVVPLDSSVHLVNVGYGGEQLEDSCKEPPPSDWVLEKLKSFGEYMGASYEGYEMESIALLMAIDARRPRHANDEGVQKKLGKSGGEGAES